MSATRVSGDDATMALSPDASGELPSMGQTLAGRYELLGLIGVGGMGSVYRARDTELDEVVALKMIARELVTSASMLERFRQEVKLARRVTHKNVARMFDIGEHESLKFLTMEFIEGESLADVLEREHVLSVHRVIGICRQVCAGLGAAHDAGVVHRDLKPDNVMIAKDGRVVITDFGIARAIASTAARTQGMPVGTPAYMAPEQVEGATDIDARADIYALGLMMYEMLVGSHPFEGDSVFAIATARLVRPPPNPQAKRRDIPDGLANVIVKCTQRRPEDRYASAHDLAAAFDVLTVPALPSTKRAPAPPAPALTAPSLDADRHDTRKLVAVLPLKNGGPEGDAHLAEGLTEDLVDALSMVEGLRVRARHEPSLLAPSLDAREVGRLLGVQVVVDGSVRRIGEAVRVSLRLVGVQDGFLLWAKRFQRPVGEVLRIGDEAATAIASALTAERASGAAEQVTDDAIAVDLYLRARQEYHRTWHDANARAIELFAQALERAPNDVKISGGYALALARRYAYEFGAEGAGAQAVQAAERTLALSPSSSSARTALAVVRWNEGDVASAAKEIVRALRHGPVNGDAHDYLGRLLLECGSIEDGIARLKMALAIEPRLAQASHEMVRAFALLGRWSEAWSQLGDPPEDLAMLNGYWAMRGRLVAWQRSSADLPEMRRLVRAGGPFEVQSLVLTMFDVIENPTLAPTLAAILTQVGDANDIPRRRSYFSQLVCEIWCLAGNVPLALAALEHASAGKLTDLNWLDRCPLLDVIRAEPRFAEVRAAVSARARAALAALEEA